MVVVNIAERENGTKITVKGHAGCIAVTGGDVVCAAVSMITTMLAQMLDDNSHLFNDYSISLESGDSCIFFSPKGRTGRLLADSMIRGYQLLENSYSNFVKVCYNREI